MTAPSPPEVLPWVRISDAPAHGGRTVEVRGWVSHLRSSGKIQFLVLRDGSGLLQCVAGIKDLTPEAWEACSRLTQESAVIVRGALRSDPRSPGGVELGISSLEVISGAEPFPISPKEHGVDFLMDHRHLWLRSARQQAILRIRAEIIAAFRDCMDREGFLLVDAPIFTPNACEGTTTLFETAYFDQKAYLTQSGQLYEEAAAMAFGRVYCFGPAFRAEKSKTRPDETALSSAFETPIFVTNYPAAVKAFYMEPDPEDPRLSLSADCLAPEGYGEIIGGGQRMVSLDLLTRRIEEHGLPQEAFEWYKDLRRYGSVPHSGFGIGVERTLAWIAGLDHVRESIPFPRMLYRLRP